MYIRKISNIRPVVYHDWDPFTCRKILMNRQVKLGIFCDFQGK